MEKIMKYPYIGKGKHSGAVFLFVHNCKGITSTELKQITTPLPPKTKPKIYPQENLGEAPKHFDCVCNKCGGKCCTGQCDNQELIEWPKIGCAVTWGDMSVTGELKGLSKSDGVAWVKNQYGKYFNTHIDLLQKPKTPEEELRDDIEYAIHRFEGDKVAGRKWLMNKYDIKKKPQ